VKKRLSGEEATPGLAKQFDLCSTEDHGQHLQKEFAVPANSLTLLLSGGQVNASNYKEKIPLFMKTEAGA
jgi:hypothetical protein